MQHLGAGHPARQLTVHVDVFAVDGVADPHFGARRLGALVDPPVDRNVGVLVDDTRGHVLALAIHLHHACIVRQQVRGLQVGAHREDLAFMNQHVSLVQHPFVFACPNGRASNPNRLLLGQLGHAVGRKRVDNA